MKSVARVHGLAELPPQKIIFRSIGGPLVEKFIHRENLALFKKRLAERRTDAEREVILKLLTEEQAKNHC